MCIVKFGIVFTAFGSLETSDSDEKNCEKVRKPKMRAKYPSAEAIPQNFVLFSSKEGAHPFVMDANVRC